MKVERDPSVWLAPGEELCTPSHADCPYATQCARAKAPIPLTNAAMADYSRELMVYPSGVVCMHFIRVQSVRRKYRAGRH